MNGLAKRNGEEVAWAWRSDDRKPRNSLDKGANNIAARHCPCKDDPNHQNHGNSAHQIPDGPTRKISRVSSSEHAYTDPILFSTDWSDHPVFFPTDWVLLAATPNTDSVPFN